MTNSPLSFQGRPPVVLGASGRIGTGFQRLAQGGHWPGLLPVWQVRSVSDPVSVSTRVWDILNTAPPDFGPCYGIIALAGAVNGDLRLNTDLALAAIELARTTGSGPVLLTSSAAVYGRSTTAMSEQADCQPISEYGKAKLAMERAVAKRLRDLGDLAPVVCILRIGNVAGADALLGAASRGPVVLDQFEDGTGPMRSYIGMLDLARTMVALIGLAARSVPLPLIVNVAAPRQVQMSALLQAAGLTWDWKPAGQQALSRSLLDTALQDSLIAPSSLAADPHELIRQSRLVGWAPA